MTVLDARIRRGPKIDPCGTLQIICFSFNFTHRPSFKPLIILLCRPSIHTLIKQYCVGLLCCDQNDSKVGRDMLLVSEVFISFKYM